GGEFLSSYNSIPTVNGISRVSFSSDTVSGSTRIRADVLDSNQAIVVTAISTELIIHGGPPYMEDINDYSTTHLTVVSDRLNIWAWVGSGDASPPAEVTVLVGDKYNNPVQKGTAVYFTTSGGVITTHTAYTDENGLANVTLYGGNPQPTIDRFYNYSGMQDPNTGENIGDHLTDPWLPDFELSQVLNTEGDSGENDGIARIMASTIGVDENQDTVRVWDQTAVVLSKAIQHFEVYCPNVNDTIPVGGNAAIYFEIWDSNGNPIVPNSKITASIFPQNAQADLTWLSKETLDPGQCYYGVTLINSIDPEKPQFVVIGAYVTIKIESASGTTEASVGPIYLGVP
ncbi:Ig-like domain-containing protein, partial [bacterium]|nr:Ig-like domain-containing protein [bacterium]